jgi:hypothetical protein
MVKSDDMCRVAETLINYVNGKLTDEDKRELENYMPPGAMNRNGYEWTVEKLKILLLLRTPKSNESLRKIISFLKPTPMGWHKRAKTGYMYNLTNSCLSGGLGSQLHCKQKAVISTSEVASEVLVGKLHRIFFNKMYE